MKYLGINLTKYMQDQYTENHKTFWKKLKKAYMNGEIYTMIMDQKTIHY